MSIFKRRHAYRGPERRHHRVFKTQNREYHCRDELCVAVRDLKTGDFVEDHAAIGKHLTGGIRFTDDGGVASYSVRGEQPHPGESLFFSDESTDYEVRTSGLLAVERPPKEIVESYHH
jgi:hypothetical protein